MLPNYDAKAVAEVMGLAFVRPGGGKAEKERALSVSSKVDHDFIIHVDDVALLIMEVKTKSSLALFGAKTTGGWPTKLKSHRVSPPSPILIEKAVENGLPRKALRHVAELIAGDDKTKVAALEWGLIPKTTLERRENRLSPLESERTERVARLFVQARRALGTEAEARAFMMAPHAELDGRSPIDAAKTELGTRRTEQILNALEYGLAL